MKRANSNVVKSTTKKEINSPHKLTRSNSLTIDKKTVEKTEIEPSSPFLLDDEDLPVYPDLDDEFPSKPKQISSLHSLNRKFEQYVLDVQEWKKRRTIPNFTPESVTTE